VVDGKDVVVLARDVVEYTEDAHRRRQHQDRVDVLHTAEGQMSSSMPSIRRARFFNRVSVSSDWLAICAPSIVISGLYCEPGGSYIDSSMFG